MGIKKITLLKWSGSEVLRSKSLGVALAFYTKAPLNTQGLLNTQSRKNDKKQTRRNTL